MTNIAEDYDDTQAPSPDHVLRIARELGHAGLDGLAIMRALDQHFPDLSYRVFLDAVLLGRADRVRRAN